MTNEIRILSHFQRKQADEGLMGQATLQLALDPSLFPTEGAITID